MRLPTVLLEQLRDRVRTGDDDPCDDAYRQITSTADESTPLQLALAWIDALIEAPAQGRDAAVLGALGRYLHEVGECEVAEALWQAGEELPDAEPLTMIWTALARSRCWFAQGRDEQALAQWQLAERWARELPSALSASASALLTRGSPPLDRMDDGAGDARVRDAGVRDAGVVRGSAPAPWGPGPDPVPGTDGEGDGVARVVIRDRLRTLMASCWRLHTRRMARLLDHDLRGPLASLVLVEQALSSSVDDTADASLVPSVSAALGSALSAALNGIHRATDCLPILAEPHTVSSTAVPGIPDEDPVPCVPPVARLVHEFAERASLRAQRVQLRVHPAFADQDPRCAPATRAALLAALDNLLRNASAASADGALLQIELSPAGSGMVCIEVQDHGSGFDPAKAGRLLRPGQGPQGHSAADHGLGLHIVSTLMARCGGRVLAESPGLGRGARFTLMIPVRDPSLQ